MKTKSILTIITIFLFTTFLSAQEKDLKGKLKEIKDAKKIAENTRISIRNIRRDANEALKKALKDHEITEDQEKQSLDEIQKLTDKYIKEIDTILEKKEKEVLEV